MKKPSSSFFTSEKPLSLCVAIIAIALSSTSAQAAGTWIGASPTSGGNGDWGNSANWSGGNIPGSTSGTISTDTATFNAAIANGWGTSATPVFIDSTTQNIGSILFTAGSANNVANNSWVIGSTTGNSLLLTSGGSIAMTGVNSAGNAPYIDTVNAPLVIEGTNGSYTFSNNSASPVATAGSGILDIGGGITAGAAGTDTLTLNGTNTLGNTVSGVIADGTASGTIAINKTGTGTWILSGANGYSGGTTVTNGALTAANATAFGTGTVLLGDTTGSNSETVAVSPTGSVTVANNFIAQSGNSGTATISTNTASQTQTLSGNITLGTASGTGHGVTLTTSNITSAVLKVTGTIQDPTNLSGTAGVLTIGTGSGSSDSIILPNANTYTGGTVLNGGIMTLGNANSLGGGTLTINGGNWAVLSTLAIANNSIWAGNFGSQNNAGNLTLSGSVSLTGTRTVSFLNGALTVGTLGGGNGVISDSTPGSNFGLNFSGATVGSSITLNGLNTFDGGVTMIGSGGGGVRLNIGNLGNSTASSIGTGTLTLGTSGNVAGLNFNNSSGADGALATNNAQIWNGDFTFVGTNSLDMGNGAVSLGTLAGATRTVTVSAKTLAEGGVISNGTNATTPTVNLTKAGTGTLTLYATEAYTGLTTITAGTLEIGNGGTTGSIASSTNVADSGTLAFNRSDNALNFSLAISGTGGVSQLGTGTTTLSGTNTYSGTTSILTGALSASSLNSVSGGSTSSSLGTPTTVAAGTIAMGSSTNTGTLIYTGSGQTTDRTISLTGTTGGATLDQSGTGILKFTTNLSNVGAASTDELKTLTLQGSTAGTGQFSGNIVDSTNGATNQKALSLVKAGTGTWTLSGTNSYTGTTTINGGLLDFGTIGSFYNSTSGALTAANAAKASVASGGTLALGVGGTGYASSTDVSTVLAHTSFASGAGIGFDTTNATAGNFTYGTAITDTASGANSLGVTKLGTNTLTLTNANTYSGGTTVSAGTLLVSGGTYNATPSLTTSATGSGAVAVNAGGTLAGSGVIHPGTGGITLSGSASSVATLSSGGVQPAIGGSTTQVAGGAAGSLIPSSNVGGLVLDNRTAAGVILNANSTANGALPNANLTFYLGAGSVGADLTNSANLGLITTTNSTVGQNSFNFANPNIDSTYISVLGNTAGELSFASGDTVTAIDLTNGNLQFNLNTPYLLIQAGSNADYTGITTTGGSSGGVAANGYVTDLSLTTGANTAANEYYGTQLYLFNGNLEIVPEPGTWALMLGGLALLVFVQRRRKV